MDLVYDVDEMLRRYRSTHRLPVGRLVRLNGLSGHDGYNPSGPITSPSGACTYVRVEPRHEDLESWSMAFRHVGPDEWVLDDSLPKFRLEDPFTNVIHGTVVIGGVRIVGRVHDEVMWETVFFRGTSLDDLQEFARSPLCMKDVRLVELPGGRVGVFTRPRGAAGGLGRIGYTEVESLDDLTTEAMLYAPLLPTQPVPEQWWGVNAVYALDDRHLGVLAHIAKWDGGHRHYYPIAFVFDRIERAIVREPQIIAERSCFPEYPARRDDLVDVIFPAWLDRDEGTLIAGLSDAAIGVIAVGDPFGN